MKRVSTILLAGLLVLGGTGSVWSATCSSGVSQPKTFVAEQLNSADLNSGLTTNTNAHNDCFNATTGHKHNLTDSPKIDASDAIIDKLQMDEVAAPTFGANHGFFYVKDVSGVSEAFYMDDSGNEIQLTDGGGIASVINTSTNFVNLLRNGGQEYWSAGTSVAPDGWTLAGAGATVAREGTTFRTGVFSAKVIRSGADATLTASAIDNTTEYHNVHFRSRAITLGAWVWSSVASSSRLRIDDGIGTTDSSLHTGGSSWEFLTVTRTLSATATKVDAQFMVILDTTAYVDGVVMVQGTGQPAFSPHSSDDMVPVIDPQGTPNANQLYKGNIVKGWINFNGTGTIAINDSFNVSSIVDNGTGNYTINWDRDFADANYAMSLVTSTDGSGLILTQLAGSVHVLCVNRDGVGTDSNPVVAVAIGNQ
ncbi:MAG: hypothetical protein J3T61_00440 [Candidatus Brocadiales bacterium]|nr:hypothetical protein [Candidatus Bathyanammoxibius sp.]